MIKNELDEKELLILKDFIRMVLSSKKSPEDICNYIVDIYNKIHPDKSGEIVNLLYSFVISEKIDEKLIIESMTLLLKKINNDELKFGYNFIESLFYFLESLAVDDIDRLIYDWIIKNKKILDSYGLLSGSDAMLQAIDALVYMQKDENNDQDYKKFWAELWNHQDKNLWYLAFVGMRYCNLEEAIKMIPSLMLDKHVDKPAFFTLKNLLDEKKFSEVLKMGLNNNEIWAGLVINRMSYSLDIKDKYILLQKIKSLIFNQPNNDFDDNDYYPGSFPFCL